MMDFRVSRTFLLLQILVWISQDMAAQFAVSVPPDPIVAVVGGDVVLDCQLVPPKLSKEMELRWINVALTYTSPVHVCKDGADDLTLQASAYKGRTELFLDQVTNGNLSLRLRHVRVSDKGQYKCFVASNVESNEAKMTLDVTATGRQPWIEMDSKTGNSIRLASRSGGWFPQPSVQWLDGNGDKVTTQPDTTYQPDIRGLFEVRSSIAISSQSKNEYTCVINNKLLRQAQRAHIQIADAFFPHVSDWLVAFWILFLVLVAAVCLALWRFRQLHLVIQGYKKSADLLEHDRLRTEIEQEKLKAEQKYQNLRKEIAKAKVSGKSECEKLLQEFETERNVLKADQQKVQAEFDEEKAASTAAYQKLQTEFEQWRPLVQSEWDRIRTSAVTVKLDPKTANSSLTVSPDEFSVHAGEVLNVDDNPERFDSVPYVLGLGGFTAGTHYWEMDVGTKAYWDLGVANGSVQRKGMPTLSTKAGFWTLGRDGELYAVSEKDRSNITVTTRPAKIGVYLELEAGRVSFYNADSMFHLYTFNSKFSDKVYPFFWPGWDSAPIAICPVKN